ncbi:hypothetical protein Tco_0453282 [Tanacetum coccineum]
MNPWREHPVNGRFVLRFLGIRCYKSSSSLCKKQTQQEIARELHSSRSTDDELTEKEAKKVAANDQAIQIILMGLPEDIYAAVDSCNTAQETWLRVQQMMKGSDIRAQEKQAKVFNERERFKSIKGESIESYYHRFLKLMNDFARNKHILEKIASNLKFLNNLQPEWKRHVTIVHQTKKLHEVDYTQLYDFLKHNQEEIAQPGINMGQDRQMLIGEGNGRNQVRRYAGKNAGNQIRNNAGQIAGNHNGYNAMQNAGNQNGNGNVVAAWAEGNGNGNNANQIRCYNCRGVAEEFDLMAVADYEEIEEVNANCILMANLQQVSTSGTQIDKAPVYDSDGSRGTPI